MTELESGQVWRSTGGVITKAKNKHVRVLMETLLGNGQFTSYYGEPVSSEFLRRGYNDDRGISYKLLLGPKEGIMTDTYIEKASTDFQTFCRALLEKRTGARDTQYNSLPEGEKRLLADFLATKSPRPTDEKMTTTCMDVLRIFGTEDWGNLTGHNPNMKIELVSAKKRLFSSWLEVRGAEPQTNEPSYDKAPPPQEKEPSSLYQRAKKRTFRAFERGLVKTMASQTIKLVQEPLVAMLVAAAPEATREGFAGAVTHFLATPKGQTVLGFAVSFGLPFLPLGKNTRALKEAVAEEMQSDFAALLQGEVADKFLGPLRKSFSEAAAKLPPMAKSVPRQLKEKAHSLTGNGIEIKEKAEVATP